MSSFLDISQLGKVYPTPKGAAVIVENFNLKVRKGEFITLIGHSGCGKSTLLNLIAGLLTPSAGALICDGREILATNGQVHESMVAILS